VETMVPCVGRIARENHGRCDGGKAHDATAKPIHGSRTHSTHYHPVPDAHRVPGGSPPFLLLRDDASPVISGRLVQPPVAMARHFPQPRTGRHTDDTVRHARRTQLQKR
jgi:hypothetical protein